MNAWGGRHLPDNTLTGPARLPAETPDSLQDPSTETYHVPERTQARRPGQ